MKYHCFFVYCVTFNNEFKTTGPAASLSKGMLNSKKYVLYIDGDILINPNDFQKNNKSRSASSL